MNRKLLAIVCLAIAPCAGAALVAGAEAVYDEAMAGFDRIDLEVAGGTSWQCWCTPASVSVRIPAADALASSSCGGERWAGSASSADCQEALALAPDYALGDLVVGGGAFWLPLPAPGGPPRAVGDQATMPGSATRAATVATDPAPMRMAVWK